MVLECPTSDLIEIGDRINHCLYVSDHGTVYKNCRQSYNCPSFVDERIKYVSSLGKLDSFNYPISMLADENNMVYGYESIYYPNYQSIFDYIRNADSSWLSFDEKKRILMDIHRTLKELNETYIVGDINLANVLVSNSGEGVMIDWENGAPIHSSLEPFSRYDIPRLTSKQNDAIKMFITSISLLYKVSFEQFFSRITVDRMLHFAKELKMPKPIVHYLEAFLYEILSCTGRVIYFDEFLQEMYGISKNSYKKVRNNYGNLLCKSFKL